MQKWWQRTEWDKIPPPPQCYWRVLIVIPVSDSWTAVKWVGGCVDDNVWVGSVVNVPVANSHVTAGSQHKLVLVAHADVHAVHAVLRRLAPNNTHCFSYSRHLLSTVNAKGLFTAHEPNWSSEHRLSNGTVQSAQTEPKSTATSRLRYMTYDTIRDAILTCARKPT